MSEIDRTAFLRAFVEAERRLAPLIETCPTVQKIADKDSGEPDYDYFAYHLVIIPDLNDNSPPRERLDRGAELARETLGVLAPAMFAQAEMENPYTNNDNEYNWLPWELITKDGPNKILREIIIDACWPSPKTPDSYDDYIRGFLTEISAHAAVGYMELNGPPPGKEEREPLVLKVA